MKSPVKKRKTYKVTGTLRQKEAINKIVENRGVISSAMIQAGYPETTAHNPSNLTESKAYKQALPDILDRLQDEIDRAIALMPKRIGKAKYRDLIEGTDKLIKNRQLLSGGSTIKANLVFGWEKDGQS